MSYCFNPNCEKPINPNNVAQCQDCGSSLILRNRYFILQPIAKGGFGRTFLAVDLDMPSKLRCVVKQFLPKSLTPENVVKAASLFKQEAFLLENLGRHMQIPTLFGYFQVDNILYFVQEHVSGQDLHKELKVSGAFDRQKLIDLLKGMLPVLKFVHEHDVIHRDIKPANILRDQEGQFMLIDFGAAKHTTENIADGTVFGSRGYVAPEQQSDRAVPASDLFSLGATCLNLITDKPPLELQYAPQDIFHWQDHLAEGVEIDDYLGDLLNKLTAPDVEQRYQNADEVLKDLDLCLQRQQAKVEDSFLFVMPSKQNFSALEQVLAAGDLKAADLETWHLLCASLNKPKNSKLSEVDIRKVPCNDFLNIDRLWIKYSAGRFGFSIKCDIYDAEGGDYKSFCDRVGYRLKRAGRNIWLDTSLVNYGMEAPKGHLPWVAGLYGSSGALGQEDLMIALKAALLAAQTKLSRFGVVKLSS